MIEPTSVPVMSDTLWRVAAIQAAIDCDPQLAGASVSVSKFAGAIWLSGAVTTPSMIDRALAIAAEICDASLRHSLVIAAEPNAGRTQS
ncbi:hypothetical protein GR212_35560 [Rhizobium lusitanum]|uniref:BON domain-containing protein n=1 Tax=Rhizobium lusitanum TaxID=293958 RepID=A0A6L9UJW3_9HYPH|nr:BON domain-containing protein [Rhizobium lusitanum]NEI74858.1 hypothetical protein [Rhizobium lusitanum]